ncbi:MAG: type II secretion system F family protein [DPANN group archaeon]|nr:type II secretion system F family protein [DPANN group archaeon]
MRLNVVLLEEFGKAFVPKRFRPYMRKYFLKAGINKVPYNLFGSLFYLTIFLTGFIYVSFIYPLLIKSQVNVIIFLLTTFFLWAGIQLSLAVVFMLLIYSYLDQRVYRRTKNLETVLQDFLRYVSENLKGGMSFERALWDAIRPKFGVLASEIRLAAKRVMTGQDVDKALTEFTEKYQSPMLKRTFNLIVEGMKGGDEIAELIDRIESNLRQTKELKDEIQATNSTYVIFLSIIATVIAPGLFGLSYNLLIILNSLSGKLGAAGSSAALPLSINSLSVSPENFATFTVYAILVTSLFSSLIISIIRYGNMRQGIKYVPFYMGISVLVYFIVRYGLQSVFGGIIT